ncbi:hypothetical protein POX_a00143 [Penicillium oxalicum]|uniref:hypothetical protein n=1 Tax=Penicillium oxalicum TaxID=69781 RepID=UPI0020B7213E|nr:hypothetical protein POX_a00143 [Penicillium oxalicum]KAI2793562.1 hypothetical protein POX_a00143 [Penicillium oxalicum]
MRPLAIITLFFATLAIASPTDDSNAENQDPDFRPVVPLGVNRCRRGYDRCIATFPRRLDKIEMINSNPSLASDATSKTLARDVDM